MEKEFPNNWSSEFVEENTISEGKEEDLLIKLTTPLESIFKNLNLSLISGEYISKVDIFEIFDSLNSKLNIIYLESAEIDNEKINKWNNRIQSDFIKPIQEGVKSYRLFTTRLIANLKSQKTRQFIIDTDDIETSNRIKAEEKLQNLFGLNLILSYIDLQLSLDREILDDLIRIKHILSSEYSELEFSNILLEKTEFLITKPLWTKVP